MNTVLVTGATGFLGKQLAIRLASEGNRVNCLFRSDEKIQGWAHRNIHFVRGSLEDRDSLDRAMQGCKQIYHLAAFASAWAKDPEIFYKQNVEGTVSILELARAEGVKKLVFTSTAGVLGPSGSGLNTEEKKFSGEHFTHYDRSKDLAEQKVMEYVDGGMNVVIVNPSRIFGPGILSKSNAITSMIGSYLNRKWRIIPGDGTSIGNYVYIEDVVNCHMSAMEKGRAGERYLAGGENLSFNEFFEILARISGQSQKMVKLPMGIMMAMAGTMQGFAGLTGLAPAITPAFVRRYNHNWAISCEKARQELDYKPISFREGLQKTIEWIRN